MRVAENPENSIVLKEIIETRTRPDEFREILLKFDLRVCGKVAFLMSLKSLS